MNLEKLPVTESSKDVVKSQDTRVFTKSRAESMQSPQKFKSQKDSIVTAMRNSVPTLDFDTPRNELNTDL